MQVNAIFGPPGTGKTRTLIDIAHREAETHGKGVLYLSYTKAAALEAVSRAKDERIRPSTLHSFAFSALGMNRAAVVDVRKKAEFAKVTGIPFQGSERGSDEIQEGDEYSTALEYAHNRLIDPMEAYDLFGCPGTRPRYERFIKEYESWKTTYGYMDFDDMLDKYVKSMIVQRSAPIIILDEAQDCTPLQWMAFIKICENAKNVYLAGDDDQAIYEWSGANPHGMVEFAEEHDGEIRILEKSWRVPQWPHEVSQQLIQKVTKRVAKKFDHRGEQGLVVKHGDIWDIDLHKFAAKPGMILVRDGFRRREIQRELNRSMIPYDVLGGYSPWTNKTAQAIRNGEQIDIPPAWVEFYRHWNPEAKVNITLSTIHQAKGRESPRVILDLQMTQRVLADLYRNRDAEIRVWYVGLTRTSNELHMCGNNPLL